VDFRWNEWNVEHIAQHGIAPEEAEYVVRKARAPYPAGREDGKYLVHGQGPDGRFLQVIFVEDEDATVYVIHARPLSRLEKHRYRRRQR
jgi:uncharacterized DUF497 family protein